jgi:hypothetical protein
MSRGWESKSVESQQDEASWDQRASRTRQATPEERATEERRLTLMLARARTVSDLEKATRPAQRQVLLLGLAAIDSELARLDAPRTGPGG